MVRDNSILFFSSSKIAISKQCVNGKITSVIRLMLYKLKKAISLVSAVIINNNTTKQALQSN